MAGDWIKVESATPDKPELSLMAEILGIDQDAVFGKLFRVWAWADQNIDIDGNAEGNDDSVTVRVTKTLIDRISLCSGFADAMQSVSWLIDDGGQITLPNFRRHNGKSAKNRSVTAKRVAKFKSGGSGKGNAEGNDDSVTKCVAGALPKEEKRREEEKKGADKPPALELPDWLPADAWQDWHQYRNARKGWTRKAKELSLRTLAELRSKGHDPRAVIEQSIECGWAGLFPIKPRDSAQPAAPRKRKELK